MAVSPATTPASPPVFLSALINSLSPHTWSKLLAIQVEPGHRFQAVSCLIGIFHLCSVRLSCCPLRCNQEIRTTPLGSASVLIRPVAYLWCELPERLSMRPNSSRETRIVDKARGSPQTRPTPPR